MTWKLIETNLRLQGLALNSQFRAFLMNGTFGVLDVMHTSDTGQKTYEFLVTHDGGQTWAPIMPIVQWQS